jgi:hypothetical protein
MKRLTLTACAGLLLAGATAAPAAAAPPEVTPISCAAMGGTFSFDKGTRYCSVVSSRQWVDENNIHTFTGQVVKDGVVYRYTASWVTVYTIETTTVYSQRGTGTVQVSQFESQPVFLRNDPVGCLEQSASGSKQVDVSVCQGYGFYPSA